MRFARNIMPVLLPCLFLAACSSSPLENQKGVAVSAYFSDSEDRGSELSIQKLWFFDSSNGELVHSTSWEDPRELASTVFPLRQGSYIVVLGANLDLPLEIGGNDSPQSLSFTLDQVSPRKVFSACTELNDYVPSRIVNLDMNLNRVTAELAVDIQGAPQGLETVVEAVNCAAAFFPAERNPQGGRGRPSDEIRSITFNSQSAMLMPTASGREWSLFHLNILTAEGVALESYIEAPRMDAGARYLMSLKYEEIQSFMHLSACPVSDWTEGWVYAGEISDPVN